VLDHGSCAVVEHGRHHRPIDRPPGTRRTGRSSAWRWRSSAWGRKWTARLLQPDSRASRALRCQRSDLAAGFPVRPRTLLEIACLTGLDCDHVDE
jgi:hypothetical protein